MLTMAPAISNAQSQSKAPEISRGGTPDWIAPREVPKADSEIIAQSSGGVTWLLTDWQIRATKTGHDSYFRSVMRVNDRSGLESAGNIRVQFDPSDTKAALSYLHIIRDGKIIDQTAAIKLDLLQREGGLDDGLLDGQITAVGNLADLRVGDVIDYATTYQVTDKLWLGHFFNTFSMRYSVPLALRTIRVTWPTEKPLNFKQLNTDSRFTQRISGADTVYELIQRNAPIQDEEGQVPGWFQEYGLITASSMNSWGEVARWASPLYQGDESIPAEFAGEVDKIAKKWSSPADRLTEAARLVQDRIRYVGIEIGEGSFVPRRPLEVVRQGFGDCKDKALLLTVVLKRLGISATPVLVATGWGRGLDQFTPGPGFFNHVIVKADLDGKPVWIDATLAHQGGRGAAIVAPDYGFVLPIRADQRELEFIAQVAPADDEQHVVERYNIDESADPAMQLVVESTFRGSLANWMRSRMASKSAREMAKDNLDYYLTSYPGIVPTKVLVLQDDRDANQVRMLESYRLPRADFEKAKLSESFPVKAYAIRGILPAKQGPVRVNPLYVNHNERRVQIIEVNAKDRALGKMPDLDLKAEGIGFKRTTTLSTDQSRIVYSLTTGEGAVPAGNAAAVYNLTEKLDDGTAIDYYLSKSPKSLATRMGLDPKELAPFEARIIKASELTGKRTAEANVEALTIFNAMSSEVKRPSAVAGLIDGLKGATLAAMNRLPAARSALEASLPQFQGSYDFINLLAYLQGQAGRPAEAVGTLKVMAAKFPERTAEIDEQFVSHLFSALAQNKSPANDMASEELTILLAQSGWQQSPATSMGDNVRDSAVRHLLAHGEGAAARKLFTSAAVSADTALSLAIDKRFSALWPEVNPAMTDRFRKLLAADVARSREASTSSPDNLKALLTYAHTLRRANQSAAAVAAVSKVVADRSRIEVAGVDGFWLVNEYAYGLIDLDQTKEAIKELDWVLSLGLDTYPDLVSQAINRGEILASADRHAEALAAYTDLDARKENYASKYGKMWVWAGIVCSAQTLGKTEIADQAMTKVEALAQSNQAAMAKALACRSDFDRLEANLISRLDDPRARGGVLALTTKSLDVPRSAFDRKMEDVMAKVIARPAVQAKLQLYGRPAQFDGLLLELGGF